MIMNTEAPTSVTQADLNLLLAQLVELKAQIEKARAALGPLEGGLEQAKREYQDRTNALLRQANRLRAEIGELDSQIRALSEPDEPEPPIGDGGGEEGSGNGETGEIDGAYSEATPIAEEKDLLLEHAYRVLDPMVNPADAELLGEIQGLVNSRMTTLGDILEYLPWGIVWEQRNQREDLAAQCARLRGWERALTAQLALLKKGEERFKNDKRYELWQRLQQGTAVWQAYLADAERKLHQEIADLEVRRNDRQATLVNLRQTQ